MRLLFLFVICCLVIVTAPVFVYMHYWKGYDCVTSLVGGSVIGIFIYVIFDFVFGVAMVLINKCRRNVRK